MAGNLTDKQARASALKEKAYKLFDGDGLYLEVAPTGSKYWRLKYRIGGKEKRISFGVYPEVSLSEAREKCQEARKLIAGGIDPSQARQEAKVEAKQEKARLTNTFETVAREWFERMTQGKNEKYRANILSYLENVCFRAFGRVPITDLRRADILPSLLAKVDEGHTETAHRIATVIGQVCEYAVQCGKCETNMVAGVTKALPSSDHKKRNAITEPRQVGQLLRDIDGYRGDITTRLGLQLMAYVFVRSNELRGAKWAEIDFDKALWLVPAERMKGRKEHLVPLSTQALALLKELYRCTGNSEFCFPSRSQAGYITEASFRKVLERLEYKNLHDVHGFRGMASTLLNEQLKCRSDVIERQLAHVEKNQVRGAYNRAQYIDERTEMMQRYADYLDSLRDNT